MNTNTSWIIAASALFFIGTLFVIIKAYVQGRIDGWRECDEAWREHGWAASVAPQKQQEKKSSR